MLTYRVDDMTCGHCASTITKAVRTVDGGARVEVDLQHHLVRIEPTEADMAELAEAITEAGYTPVAVQSDAVAEKPAKTGGCCGCCG
jgi:copper chaperone